jgi:flagellar hook protein FlgE
MLASLSTGVSGLDSYQEEMNVIGNNIANLNTTAFKAAEVNFSDALSNTLEGANATTPAEQVGTGVDITGISNNWNQGALENTGVTSNLAVSGTGNGFFIVENPQTPTDQYVTQDGTFQVSPGGNLQTSTGYNVVGYQGTTTTIGPITITPPAGSTATVSSYTVSAQGVITMTLSDGTTAQAGQVLLQSFQAPQMLVSAGDNLYSNQANAGPTVTGTGGVPGSNGLGTIQSGALEASNVDLSNEMANLITAQQAFDANSKMITTSSEVLQTVVQMKQG